MKFHIIVFGCQMNYADSARIKAILLHCGLIYTDHIDQADIIIFHTCSVRQKSEDKITGQLKNIQSHQKIWITGCMIQHTLKNGKIQHQTKSLKIGNFSGIIQNKNPQVYGITNDEIHSLNGTTTSNHIIGINNIFNPLFHKLHTTYPNLELMRRIDDTGFLPLILKKLGYNITYDQELINEYETIIPVGINTSMNNHSKTAYIPISTGCNQFCAYCIVPYARGLERHFSMQHILDEVNIHLNHGVEEIVLLGQIVNKHPNFIQMIKKILTLPGLRWLRYTSPYPTYYTQELLALHEKETKLCPHIHIPLQSGSDNILKKMFRGYSVQEAQSVIKNIQNLKRNISITTDIIVGFPGETEEDFQQTLELVKYGNFDMIYIGIYSPRPGTFGAKNYPDTISRETKRDRRNRLNNLLTTISHHNNQKEIGNIRTMLINNITPTKDNTNKENKETKHHKPSSMILSGYTDNMKQITIKHTGYLNKNIGDFVQCKIIEAYPFMLKGEILN